MLKNKYINYYKGANFVDKDLELAKRIWKDTGGDFNISWAPETTFEEDNFTIKSLLERGVVDKIKSRYAINSRTKNFIENNGKTDVELKAETKEKREKEIIEIAKKANNISYLAIAVSLTSLVVSILLNI